MAPLPVIGDFRELGMKPMLQVVDGHDVGNAGLEPKRRRGRKDDEIEAEMVDPLPDLIRLPSH